MNYHFVQQEDWNDCGLACLAMLIENYHQKRFSIYQLKEHLDSISELGLSFFDLIQLGQKYKLKGEGFNCDFALLKENSHRCPFILNIKNEEGISHYVVLNKVNNDYFYLNDPSQKHPLIKLKSTDLEKVFLNKILVFQKYGILKQNLNLFFLHHWLKEEYWSLFCLVFCTLLANFFWILSSSFIQIFSQWISQNFINWWELGMFIIYVGLACFFDFCQEYNYWVWSQKTWLQLLNQFLLKKEKGIKERIWSRSFSELKEKLNFLQLFCNLIVQNLLSLIYIPILELWIWKINNLFCFLPFIFLVIIIFGKLIFKKKNSVLKTQQKFYQQNYQEGLNHYLTYSELIQNRGLKKIFFKKIEKQGTKYQKINQKVQCYKTINIVWEKFWSKIFYFTLLVIVYFVFQIGKLSPGDLLYLIILSNYLLSLLNQNITAWLDFFFTKNVSFQENTKKLNYENQNLGLEKVEHFILKEVVLKNKKNEILIINQTFDFPFFVSGNEEFIDYFFKIFTNLEIFSGNIKINNQDFQFFQNDFFILTQNMELIPGTLIENLFNWNIDLDPQLYEAINLLFWLEKYQIDFSRQNFEANWNLQQKQLINFLASFFSLAKIFIFQNCLNALDKTDQEKLISLFLQLKTECFVILTADNLILERKFCQKLVLNPMI